MPELGPMLIAPCDPGSGKFRTPWARMQAENLAPSGIFIMSPPPAPPDPVFDDGASPPPVEVVVAGAPRLATLGEFELPPQPARTTVAATISGRATESERIEHQLLVRAGDLLPRTDSPVSVTAGKRRLLPACNPLTKAGNKRNRRASRAKRLVHSQVPVTGCVTCM